MRTETTPVRALRGRTAAVTLAGALLATILASCAEPHRGAGVGPGEPFPIGSFARLASEGALELPGTAGRPVIVNVWATWCEPCRREMQSIERLHRRHGGDLRVVGISVDADRHLAREFVARQKLTFENGLGTAKGLAAGDLAVTRLPTTFLVDASGIVRLREEAPRDWAEPRTVARMERLLGVRLEAR